MNKYWLYLGLALLLIKAVLLFLDPEPMFIIGDSAVYIKSALVGSTLPIDRSFCYGLFFIRPILALFGSLHAVVAMQSLCSALSSLLLAVILDRYLQAPRWISTAAALLYAIEPLSLMYERFILTETLSTLFFVLFLWAALDYMLKPKFVGLLLLALLSIPVVSLRVTFIPVLFLIIAVAPFLAHYPLPKKGGLQQKYLEKQKLIHFLIVMMFTFSFHAAYKEFFHEATGAPPAYSGASGLFLLASWAPLVQADDFPTSTMGHEVLSEVNIPLKDRFSRPQQRFSPGGLVDRLIKFEGGYLIADKIGHQITHTILHRDALGILLLGGATYSDFWDPSILRYRMYIDEGQLELDQDLIDYFNNTYNENLAGHPQMITLSKTWHSHALPWYFCILISPLLGAAAIMAAPNKRREAFLLFLCSVALFATITLFVTEAVVRYLHPLAWLTVLISMSLFSSISRKYRSPSLNITLD